MNGSDERYDVLIVGAGHGGAQAAAALRQAGFAGSVALVGEEPELPYERPPLSKEYLAGDKPFARMLLRPPGFWADRGITLMPGRRIVTVDPDTKTVADEHGARIGYGSLIWAAGGAARRMTCDGHALAGVHGVRTRADVDRLVGELPGVARPIVIGGGYIGLEAAAGLRKAGKRVVLIEAQDRVLARVAGGDLSRFYEAEHRAHGVDLMLGRQVGCILGDERVTGVRLTDGAEIAGEMVIVGIGIAAEVAPLLAAGAAGDDGSGAGGVLVDAQCRTTLAQVYAVGDCALHANRYADGRSIRLESVQNANDQATVAAKTIAGHQAAYDAVPWFWSNQYDLKLQTVGLSAGYDRAVLRGRPADRSFSVVYFRNGTVVALDCVNAVRDYVQGRRLVQEAVRANPARVADPDVPLKEL